MSNVETFKFYASQLNLTKPQLEAVTDCFKACFEAHDDGETEPQSSKVVKPTPETPNRMQHTPFEDPEAGWGQANMDKLLGDIKNKRLANALKGPGAVPSVDAKDARRMFNDASDAAEGRYGNIVDREEERQRGIAEEKAKRLEAKRRKNMERQKFLNRELGINLDIDGIWGKQSQAAYEEYLARKNGVKGKNRNPALARTAGPASSFDVTNVNSPLNQVAMGNRTPGQVRTTGAGQQEITNVNSPLTNQVADRGMSRYGGQTRTSGPSRTPASPNVDWKNQQTAYNVDFMDGVNAERPAAKATKQPISPDAVSRYTYNAPQEPIGMTSRYQDLDEWSPLQDKMPY